MKSFPLPLTLLNIPNLSLPLRPLRAALLGSALAACFGAANAVAGPDVDCTMCHDEAPVPAEHMPVDEVSVESCAMCHEASGDDPYFRTIHDMHGESLGCDSCHSDASEERAAKLKEMLGQ